MVDQDVCSVGQITQTNTHPHCMLSSCVPLCLCSCRVYLSACVLLSSCVPPCCCRVYLSDCASLLLLCVLLFDCGVVVCSSLWLCCCVYFSLTVVVVIVICTCAGDKRGRRWERIGLRCDGADRCRARPPHTSPRRRQVALPVPAALWLRLQPVLFWERPTLPDGTRYMLFVMTSPEYANNTIWFYSHVTLKLHSHFSLFNIRTVHVSIVKSCEW